jgi:aldose 1-epimerase
VPAAAPPSGQQIEIRHGRQRAVVVEVGGGLRAYSVDDLDVIDGYPAERMADGGRGQPLLPWPNRLADGQYEWDGTQLQLPVDELGRRNASHGLTRWLNWTVAERSDDRVRLSYLLHPRPGYPFILALAIEYHLSDAGLSVRTTAHNCGERALPFGAGFHPYLSVGTQLIDTVALTVPARQVLDVDQRMLPTGTRQPVAGSDLDFRTARPIGEQILDHCFADLERDADGRARVVLAARDDGASVSLWLDGAFKYLQVFSGDTLARERRRRGLAVEPMTCPPNAFRTSTDVVRLEPDQQHTSVWGLTLTKC